jgi:hypothetical protein
MPNTIGSLPVKVYNPDFEVIIHTKKFGMRSFRDTVIRIDVRGTSRDIAGDFRIIFVPKENDSEGNTIYDLVEPMDYVEIRARRLAGTAQFSDRRDGLTVLTRGFVTKIEKQFSISDGKPQRAFSISGENYSKLIRMAYIHYAAGLDPSQIVIAGGTQAPLFFGYGIDLVSHPTPPSQAISETFNKLVKPNFDNIKGFIDKRSDSTQGTGATQQQFLGSNPAHLYDDFGKFDLFIDEDGVDGKRLGTSFNIVDPAAGSKEQSVYEFMNNLAGRPWNELYVDDKHDGTYLVFRPTPWRNRKGEFVESVKDRQDGSLDSNDSRVFVECYEVDEADVLSFNLKRSDEEVYNYYFTDAAYSPVGEPYEWIMRSRMVTNMGDSEVRNPHYVVGTVEWTDAVSGTRRITASDKLEYSRVELYGFRKYWNTSKFLAVDPNSLAKTNTQDVMADIYKDFAAGSSTPNSISMIQAGDALTKLLFNSLEHNSALESGTITLKGNEFIRQGVYIKLKTERKQQKPAWFYVVDVSHTIIAFQSYITTLSVIRGETYLQKRENF